MTLCNPPLRSAACSAFRHSVTTFSRSEQSSLGGCLRKGPPSSHRRPKRIQSNEISTLSRHGGEILSNPSTSKKPLTFHDQRLRSAGGIRSRSSIPQQLSDASDPDPSSAFPPGPSSSSTPLTLYGQPLPRTHPHLFSSPAANELTPGITAQEYEDRRRRLMEGLEDGAVVVCLGARIKYMSQSIFYKFRQATDSWYLTGWQEPDSAVVLEKKSSTKRGYTMTMFVKSKDKDEELWNGPRTGTEGAVEIFGADKATDSSRMTSVLRSILSSATGPIYVDIPDSPNSPPSTRTTRTRRSILNFLSSATDGSVLSSAGGKKSDYDALMSILNGGGGKRVKSLKEQVERLRVIKSDAEINLMRRAADISSRAHESVMRFAEPGMPEYALTAHFEYQTALAGAERPAYVPVCASSSSALTIHYTANDHILQPSTLVLIDAGCEYHGYASDITRTFPVSGKFTGPQKDLYQVVLEAERECIKFCREDRGLSLNELHRKSCDELRSGLRQLGFGLRVGDLERILYPHFLSHPLGIDLHDTSTFQRSQKIRSGMVITIEPGIYVPPDPAFPKHFHNLGVRVEDEVLVREDDYVVLSVDAPKEVVDVEAACQGFLDGVKG